MAGGSAVLALAALALAAVAAAEHPLRRSSQLQRARGQISAAAPGGAPGGAPGAAPGAAPAGPTDKWGADTHAEEFGSEYAHHEHKTVKEPHVGDAAWQSEMHKNPGDFDPHGQDFVTDSRSPVVRSGSGRVAVGVMAAFIVVAVRLL